MQSRSMRIALLIYTVLVAAFGGILALFWAADTFLIGEFERESVPAGKWAIDLLAAASLSSLLLYADYIRKRNPRGASLNLTALALTFLRFVRENGHANES